MSNTLSQLLGADGIEQDAIALCASALLCGEDVEAEDQHAELTEAEVSLLIARMRLAEAEAGLACVQVKRRDVDVFQIASKQVDVCTVCGATVNCDCGAARESHVCSVYEQYQIAWTRQAEAARRDLVITLRRDVELAEAEVIAEANAARDIQQLFS